jgi:hypothetical protein
MKPSPKVEAVAEEILAAFRDGRIPAALAQIFIHRKTDSPSLRWSLGNRLIAALHGHFDARGFRQWKAAGRHVKRGEHAFYILGPCLRRRSSAHELADTGSGADEAEELVLTGFTAIAVFGYAQTEGEPLPGEEEERAFISTRPLIEVARSWDLAVTTFPGEGTGRLGTYRPGAIALGVENLSTWSHELVHYAARPIMPSRPGSARRDREMAAAEIGIIRAGSSGSYGREHRSVAPASRSSSRQKPRGYRRVDELLGSFASPGLCRVAASLFPRPTPRCELISA